ncbi:VIT family protein [Microlunatus aurantiacus]
MADDQTPIPPVPTEPVPTDPTPTDPGLLGAAPAGAVPHGAEPHGGGLSQRLNWLRAGVLGANDGIVSTAALVVGVAGATAERGPILTAGIAGLVAGAVSMALGEYVSVSSQRDSERALLDKERAELATSPEEELEELAALYVAKGASPQTARRLAEELTAKDAFAAHVDVELGIDPDALTSPWQAALSSAVAFTIGSILPLLAMVLSGPALRIPLTFATVLVALAITGAVSARLGSARVGPAVLRLVLGGSLAMTATYLIGRLLGASGL